jgi:hypothetical protein
MEQQIVNFLKTGYKPPSWRENLKWIVKELFTGKPSSVDMTASAPYPINTITDISKMPVLMQGLYPNCVEEAVTWAKMYYDFERTGIVPDLSPFFLFFESGPSENGTSLKTALECARTVGICERKYFTDPNTGVPYNGVPIVPSDVAVANASTHKISAYAYTNDVSSIDLNSLIHQFGIVIVGMQIDSKWWLPSWGNLAMPITPPVSKSTTLSDHCDILYGYNGEIRSVRNSWSMAWGNGGNATIDPTYLSAIYEVAVICD